MRVTVSFFQKMCYHLFGLYEVSLEYVIATILMAIIFALTPYFGGKNILGHEIPQYPDPINKWIKVLGPILVLLSIAMHLQYDTILIQPNP